MWRASLLLALVVAATASPTIGLIATPGKVQEMPALLNYSLSTNTYTTLGSLTLGESPVLSAYMADQSAVIYTVLSSDGSTQFRVFSLTTQKVVTSFSLPDILILSLHYDFNLKQLFGLAAANGVNWAVGQILLTNPPSFSTIMSWPLSAYSTPVPAATTYCPMGHIFFMPIVEDASFIGPFQLYRIDVTKGTILSNVTLDEQSDSLNNLFWDYSAASMYAALSANVSELLVKVNITTGDFSPPIGRGPNFNSFGLVAIDVPTHYIYSLCPVSSTNSSVGIWGFDLTASVGTFVDIMDASALSGYSLVSLN